MFKILLSTGLFLAGMIEPTGQYVQASTKPNLQVAVISDTHIDLDIPKFTNKFENAMDDLKTVAPSYDVIAVNGDMTDFGRVNEYNVFNSILKAKKIPTAEEFMVIGNHEWLESQLHPSISDEVLKKRFLSKMNVSNLYYDKWIKGYHFITIAGEKSENTMIAEYGASERDSAYISDQQFQWLETTLSMNADSSKPIFVFFHQPISNTVYGSEWSAGLEDKKILALLRKFPQVILFTGHSHYPINEPKSIYQDGITMANTSSVAYTYTPTGKENYTQSQGYLVNVYDNKVEIKAREFSDGTWIKTVTIPLTQRNERLNFGWVNAQGHWYYLGILRKKLG